MRTKRFIASAARKCMLWLLFGTVMPGATLYAQDEFGEWRFLGLQDRIVQKLQMHEGYLYATTDDGLYRKRLQTADTLWTPMGLQGKRTRALLVFDADTLLASTEFDTISLYRTTDGGMIWQPYQNGFGGGTTETVRALARHPQQSNVLFATGANVVATSHDRGQSWQILHGDWQAFGTGTNFVTIDSNDTRIIWAGGQNAIERAFVWKSEDGGVTWREWPEIVEDVSSAKTVAIHPHDSETVYAGLESFILKTSDGGDNWEEILVEDGRFFFGLAINPSRPQRMYAASWFKTSEPQPLIMFISDDGGETWQQTTEPNARFGGAWDMLHIYDGVRDRLYLGLNKGGVYEFIAETPTSVDPGPPVIATFRLEQNYPNPFNPETVIAFSLPQSQFVTLKVYNLRGQEVATLAAGLMAAGEHKLRWQAKGLASGVYIYRLQSGDRAVARRLVILR